MCACARAHADVQNYSCQHVIKCYEIEVFNIKHYKGITFLKLQFSSSKVKDLNEIAKPPKSVLKDITVKLSVERWRLYKVFFFFFPEAYKSVSTIHKILFFLTLHNKCLINI